DKFIRFTDSITHDTVTINAFSAAIVSMYDNEMFMRFAKRNKKQLESINYRGGSMPFIKIDYEDVNDSCNLSMLKDKIVLMGYLGMYKGAPMDTIDAFFTPLERCDGYDAKGIEIHAHAISMIMNDDCLITLEPWQNKAIAFIITFFFVLWLVYWYVFGAKFFDILSKPIQFLLIGIVLLISYYVMKEFGIKVDMMPTGIMLIFCIEVLYLYEETLELFKIDSFITQTFKYTKDERNKVLRSIVRFEFIRNKFKRSDK
ncbi:MAG: CHASE2 domain-containing protein, partial [Bacteroidales bacterium]|nr:CHASE2 domain-containing protein [Bacteroidales bacterium]